MSRHVDMVGRKFGRLVVLRYLCRSRTLVRCRCDCGAQSDHDAADLRRGHTRSCGCSRRLPWRRASSLARQRWAGVDRLSEDERAAFARWVGACGYKPLIERTGVALSCLRRAGSGACVVPVALAAIRALLAQPAPVPACQHPGCPRAVVLGVRGRRCIYCPVHRSIRTGRPQRKAPAPAPAPAPLPARPRGPRCPRCQGPLRYQGGAPYCARNRCEEAAVLPLRRAA